MKKLLYVLVMTMMFMGWSAAHAGGSEWLTDFEAAKKEAEERKVLILANFAGSDWCTWCIKLDREVFSKKEFKNYAKDNLVLFLADFPNGKKQSDEVKRQNGKLAKEYGVQGFPTVLLLDADGKVIARTGYRKGGASKYVEHLKDLARKESDDS